MSFIVPAGKEAPMDESARKAAEEAASGIKRQRQGAYMYLLQHDSTAVTERRQGKGGDWLVAGLDDERVVNLGDSPMLLVVGHQVRYVQTRKDQMTNRPVVVFNLPWESMNAKQQAATELSWDDPNSARPVDSFTLIHVTDKGIDPNKIGKFNFQPKPGSAKAAGKWVADLGGTMRMKPNPVAPFSAIWRIGSTMTTNQKYNSKKLALSHSYAGSLAAGSAEWGAMQALWYETAKENHVDPKVHAAVEHDDPHANADDIVIEEGPADRAASGSRVLDAEQQGYDDYATSLPSEGAEPEIPDAAKAVNFNFDTPLYCGMDANGNHVRKSAREMTQLEAKAAVTLATPHESTNPKAKAGLRLIEAVCETKGWDKEALGLSPF